MADLGELRKNVGGGRREIRTTVVAGNAVLLVLSPQYSLRPSSVMRHVAAIASVLCDRPVAADVRLIGCLVGGPDRLAAAICLSGCPGSRACHLARLARK